MTLGGQPLVGAEVAFAPENGRPSVGLTDGTGRYTAMYLRGVKGAKVGKHRVYIAWPPAEPASDDAGPRNEPPRPRIPIRYNFRSELTAEVKAGSNTIDFALESR